jgi:hypothetical protein
MCSVELLFGAAGVAGVPPGIGSTATAGLIGSGGLPFATGASLGPTALGLSKFGTPGDIFGLGGMLLQGYGSYAQGQFVQAQAEQQARIALFNKRIAENDAILARQAAELDKDRMDDFRKQIAASAQTGYGKSGVEINIDTPLAIQERIVRDAVEDQFNRDFLADQQVAAAQARAVGARATAANLRLTSKLAQTASRIKAIGPVIKAGESLLS